ncbi:hypothetical protein ACF0H5_014548 [Mactra antiquata]
MDKLDIASGSENIVITMEEGTPIDKLNDFQYVCCNIPSAETDTRAFEEQIQGCTCEGVSCDITKSTSCECMRFGPTYDSDGKLLSPGQSDSKSVFLECNSSCKCLQSCANRVVQNGIRHRLQLFYDQDKGFGVRTQDSIKCGEFVCEYTGEILTEFEATRRARDQSRKGINFIFVLREHVTSGIVTTFIDPSSSGNIGRFINHSCEPNMCIRPVRVHNLVPRVCFFVNRDIKAGEELAYSYGSCDGYQSAENDGKPTVCLCGSKKCSGYLPCDRFVLS